MNILKANFLEYIGVLKKCWTCGFLTRKKYTLGNYCLACFEEIGYKNEYLEKKKREKELEIKHIKNRQELGIHLDD